MLVAFDLCRLICQPLRHLSSFPLVDFLHLTVLVTDDRDILLSQPCLLSELILEGKSLVDIVLLCLGLRLLGGQTGGTHLLSHSIVLLSDLL